MAAELRDREAAALELVRALARALVAHRLYPDDPTREGFATAVEQVRETARVALAVGAVRFEIGSGAVVLGDRQLRGGEQVERLALECFSRRVEELEVRSLPDANDVHQFCRALTLPAEEVAAAGGVQALLDANGVGAIGAGELRPDPADRDAILASLPPELRQLWGTLGDPERLATNLLVAGLHPNPAQAAQELYRRFGALHDALPENVVGRTGALRRIREVIDLLPEPVQREFFAAVVTGIESAPFAANYVTNLTDHDLVTAILRLGEDEGPDVGDVAEGLIDAIGRPTTVVSMLEARLEAEVSHADEPASLATMTEGEDGSAVRAAVADALGNRLVDEASADLLQLRELYPAQPADLRVIAQLAFRDYVRSEHRGDRLERALEGWTEHTRSALRRGDADGIARLLGILDLDGDLDGKGEVIAAARAAAVTPEVVADVVDPAEDLDPLVAVLRPFGGPALDTVLDLLADEEDQARRAHLVGLAVGLIDDRDIPRVAGRLADPRWYVVRNLATILGRLGSPETVPHLVPLLRHDEPAVRREAVRSLVASAGADAVTHLERVATDPDTSVRRAVVGALAGLRSDAAASLLARIARSADEHGDRQRAIELLAAHPSDRRVELLGELASRRSQPRLPRSLRKLARAAARNAGRAR